MTSLKDYFAKKYAVPEISSSSRCRSTTVLGLKCVSSSLAQQRTWLSSNQSKQLDASSVRTIKNNLIRFVNELRTDDHFQKLFDSAKEMCTEMSLEMPTLPRRKRAPKKMQDYYGQISKDHACESGLNTLRSLI